MATKVASSTIFPVLPIATMIPELVQKAIAEGTNKMLRELRSLFG